jgi:hypothetical protein
VLVHKYRHAVLPGEVTYCAKCLYQCGFGGDCAEHVYAGDEVVRLETSMLQPTLSQR